MSARGDFHCLVIMDSRGRGMLNVLGRDVKETGLPIHVNLLFFPGADIHQLVQHALEELKRFHYDMILFIGGVNDLSSKGPRGRAIPKYNSQEELVEEMFGKFETAQKSLAGWCRRVVVSLLVGLDFSRYNSRNRVDHRDYSHYQSIVDDGLVILNKAIASLNTDSGTLNPWVLDTVHYRTKQGYLHKYFKLSDGLHLSNTLRERWVYKMVTSVCSAFGKTPSLLFRNRYL